MLTLKIIFLIVSVLNFLFPVSGKTDILGTGNRKLSFRSDSFVKPFIKFSGFGLAEGLSQSVVLDIVQDSDGFIWLATQDGLNRFDGYKFAIFRYNPEDSTSIGDNWITCLEVESDSSLLVGTKRAGLYRMNLRNNNFKKIEYSNSDESQYVHDIQIDKNGRIWTATWGDGIYVIDEQASKIKRFNETNGLTSDFVSSILISRDARKIWLATGLGLDSLCMENDNIGRINLPVRTGKEFEDNFTVSLLETESGTLFVGTQGGVVVIGKTALRFASVAGQAPGADNIVNDILEDKNGFLWFATANAGIARTRKSIYSADFNDKDMKFFNYPADERNPYALSGNYVRKIFEDKSENIWLGTWGAGVSKFDAKPPKFNVISNLFSDKKILPSNSVSCFMESGNGKIIIGTHGGGAVLWNAPVNSFSLVPLGKKGNNGDVKFLYKDRRNNIWAATGYGLFKWNGNKTSFEKTRSSSEDINLSVTMYGLIEFNDFLLLSTAHGLIFYNPQTNALGTLSGKAYDKNFENYRFNYFLAESKDEFWLGTTNAFVTKIKVALSENGTPIIIGVSNYAGLVKSKKKRGLTRVNHISKSKDGTIWISASAGLCRLVPPYDTLTIYDANDGLPNEIVYAACEDNNGNIWISTNLGVSKLSFRKNKVAIRNFTADDGLQSNEFNQAACYKRKNGEIFFGGIKGFNYFSPEKLRDNPYTPNVVLTSVKIFNKEIPNFSSVLKDKFLQIDYSQNMLSFVFASLEFTNPSQNRYAHKLEGFNDEWIYDGTERTAIFTNLNPGVYELFAKSSNNDNKWSDAKKILTLEILPPFWMTWQFKSLMAVLALLIVWLIYYNRIRYLMKIESLRLKIASDLHDEVGSLLTQISINSELLPFLKNEKETSSTIELIRDRSAQVIKIMSDVIWAIDSRNDSMESLIDRVHQFAYSFLKQKGIKLIFTNEVKNQQRKLKIEVRQNLMLIAKEAINNAVKYSGCNSVSISFSEKKGTFSMIIHDNGKGLPSEIPSRGNGIKNMKLRSQIIGAELSFVNDNGLKIIVKLKKI